MSEDIIRGIQCSGPDKGVYLSCAYCSRTWPETTKRTLIERHIEVKHPRKRRAS